MRILLVYSNTYRFLNPPPIGAAMVARAAVGAGHEVRLLDLMVEDAPDAALEGALADGPWDLVGLSLRNLDNQDMAEPRNFVPEHVRRVQLARRAAPVVIGGSALMSAPEALFERTGADYAICGQADRVFPRFLEELAAGGPFRTPGAMWWEETGDGRRIRRNPGRLDGYPEGGSIPWEHIDHRRYRPTEIGFPVLTKSGCRYQCLFCDTPASFGDRFVPRPAEQVVEDLRRDAQERGLTRYQTFFVDACFNEPLDWSKELLEALVRSGLVLGLSAIVEPTPGLDREFVRLFRRAGGTMVTSLVGSVTDGMLRTLRRPYGRADIERAFDLFEQERLAYMPQLLLGGPGETEASVEESFAFLERRRPLMADFGVGLRIQPEAGLYEVALREGVIDADTDLLEPRFYFARGLDAERIRRRARAFKRRWPPVGQWARYLARVARLRFA